MLEDVSFKLRVRHRIKDYTTWSRGHIGAAIGDNMVEDGSSPALLETTLE